MLAQSAELSLAGGFLEQTDADAAAATAVAAAPKIRHLTILMVFAIPCELCFAPSKDSSGQDSTPQNASQTLFICTNQHNFFFSSTVFSALLSHHTTEQANFRGSQECGRIASEHGRSRAKVATGTAPRFCLSISRSDGVQHDRKLVKFAFGKIKDQVVYKHI